MPKLFIVSLGCPKNLTDAEAMAGRLAADGYELVSDEAEADTVLVNTCSFLASAEDESAREIERFSDLKRRGLVKKLIVTGCLVEKARGAVLARFPEVDAIVGVNSLDFVGRAAREGENYILPSEGPLNSPRLKLRLTAPHSAYLKIADGCDNRCSYCAIPSIRGRFRSKPLEQALDEAAKLAESGASEISLIAQDTTSYGLDLYGRPRLTELIKGVLKLRGLRWLRLMYVYPDRVTPDLIAMLAGEPKLCKYLDMPLQHISTPVLARMNRRSTERSVKAKLAELRKKVPGLAIRSTFITGFPGETEADHRKLLKFVGSAGFENLAVFKYSREEGTPAANLDAQVPEAVKESRLGELIAAQSRALDERNLALVGKKFELLMDSPAFGRTYMDAPDIDGKVEIVKPEAGSGKRAPVLKAGDFVKAEITGASGYMRRARII